MENDESGFQPVPRSRISRFVDDALEKSLTPGIERHWRAVDKRRELILESLGFAIEPLNQDSERPLSKLVQILPDGSKMESSPAEGFRPLGMQENGIPLFITTDWAKNEVLHPETLTPCQFALADKKSVKKLNQQRQLWKQIGLERDIGPIIDRYKIAKANKESFDPDLIADIDSWMEGKNIDALWRKYRGSESSTSENVSLQGQGGSYTGVKHLHGNLFDVMLSGYRLYVPEFGAPTPFSTVKRVRQIVRNHTHFGFAASVDLATMCG